MRPLSRKHEQVLHLFIIAATYLVAVVTTIFSLTHGIFEVFPLLYILPIILAVSFYPRKAVLITLAISLTYIGLVYLYGFTNHGLIAIATAWFAILITIGVVSSSYATGLLEERGRIRSIIYNSQEGILCFDLATRAVLAINIKCARWLKYDQPEILGSDLAVIWTEPSEREHFIDGVKTGQTDLETEGLFRAKDGAIHRFRISSLMVTRNRVLCSVIDITGNKVVDAEIQKTLEDLEEQVRARTAHLEKINEELLKEILERRRFERTILPENTSRRDRQDDK
jgi:hypothetical protein